MIQKDYRTLQFRITQNDELFDYCDQMSLNAKNLYNVGLFHIRQLMSGLQKDKSLQQENEKEVIQKVKQSLVKLNDIKETQHEKKNQKRLQEKKEPLTFFPYEMPTSQNWFLSKNLLDGVLKLENNSNYRALPAQSSQAVLELVIQAWKSYFAAIKDYRIHPSKYTGEPKIPKYAKKEGRKVAVISNQDAVIYNKETKYLKLPKTNLTYDLSKTPLPLGEKLKQVRIVPSNHFYILELVFEIVKPTIQTTKETSNRIIALDLGVNNFATITNNFGKHPLIVKGGIIKNKNQWWNKQRAHYYGILRQGKQPNEGPFTSKRLQALDVKRHSFMKDFFHKASKQIIDYCVENNVDTIVIGKNNGWKTEVEMQKKEKQHFIQLPFNLFISTLTYKANEKGLLVLETEESYTSKASFLDRDEIPTYGQVSVLPKFSGYRASRGMYKSYKYGQLNADVNGSANILRKVFPCALTDKDKGVLKAPQPLLVSYKSAKKKQPTVA